MRFDYEREYDWLIISQSYFQCALMGARILNKRLNKFAITEGSPSEYCLKEIYGDYRQEPAFLIFPILFNFKHGIEIYLKSIIGIVNSEFPKNHDLLNLLDRASIKDEKIKNVIRKYAFGYLLLPMNKKCDTENQFERYPQGSPYDSLELFTTINNRGEKMNIPEGTSIDYYFDFIKENNAQTVSIINQEKINELIADITFLYKSLRGISLNIKDDNISFLP